MEHTLLLLLMGSSVLITLLSFDLGNVIVLRLISGMFLVGTSLVVLLPVLYIGFGSQNVITYGASAAGDPGTEGTKEILSLGFGLVGMFQIVYSLVLMLRLAFAPVSQETNTPNPDAEAYV